MSSNRGPTKVTFYVPKKKREKVQGSMGLSEGMEPTLKN